jgi:hypothetical protein
LKQAVEHGPGGALFVCEFVGVAYLAKNFRFAEHHGIEASGDAEKVAHGLAIVVVVERNAQKIVLHRMKFAEERGKPRRGFVHRLWRNAIDFAAIAGGKHQRLFEQSAGAQFVGSAAGLLVGERHPFAHLKRRGTVVQSDKDNFHAAWCP